MPFGFRIWLSLSTIVFTAISAAANNSSTTTNYSGSRISLRYPTVYYSRISDRAMEVACHGDDSACLSLGYIRLHKVRPAGGSQVDSASTCLGSIATCSNIRGGQNYSISSDGEVKISDPTAAVSKREMGKWVIYEAFWLCGWRRMNGEYFPYGGQCYSAVLSSKDKTVEFNFLLGEAGCRKIETCWRKPLKRIRRMLSSVE